MKKKSKSASRRTLPKKKDDNGRPFEFLGTGNNIFGQRLVRQALDSTGLSLSDDSEPAQKLGFPVYAALASISPRDEIEGMFVTQFMAVHNAAMECFRCAMLPNQTVEGREIFLRRAERLSKIFIEQVGALENYRGRRHKVKVGQVNVESGGQAIVGDVQHNAEQETEK